MRFHAHSFSTLPTASDDIISFIREKYIVGTEQYEIIRTALVDFFGPLRDDIFVFIEHPYVDKVYRDSYYHYFSTKYREYPRDCIRISFFDIAVKQNDIEHPVNVPFLEQHFLGYCVLRPTFPNIIGRNLLDKSALKDADFVNCIHKEDALVNGVKLQIAGFPHSSQDQESITCAETTVWAIMEYFGHKYAEYKPVLPSSIINKLNEYANDRMLPSSGLTVEQISFVLKDFGFGTKIYTEANYGNDFLPCLSHYVESGFPVIASLENKKDQYAHAIVIIGRQKICRKDLLHAFDKRKEKLIPFESIVSQFVIQDDNLPPYSLIPIKKPGIHYPADSSFASYKISGFVVPLYKKMYMEAGRAREVFKTIYDDQRYGFRSREPHIFRLYMASSRSFKEHIAQQKNLNKKLQKVLLAVAMPRFIWCGEYINRSDAAQGTVSSLFVLDATEASDNWSDSFIFAAHKNETIFYGAVDHTYQLFPVKLPFEGFCIYEKNLN